MPLSRRDAIRAGSLTLATAALARSPTLFAADTKKPKTGLPIGFSTYGLPEKSLEEVIELVERTGYDALEICVTEDRDQCAEKMPHDRRRAVRGMIRDHDIELPSLMEHLQPLKSAEQHRSDLDRLKRTSNLAHDLNPEAPPIIQTVLGGKDWETQKGLMTDRVADWIEIANSHEVVVAVKPHRGHAMSRPSNANWLFQELGKPSRLRLWFDYSHFALRDMSIETTVEASLPMMAGVAVKDVQLIDGKVRFALPGEAGTIDYKELLSTLYESGYRESICVEVSSQVWRQPGYDPIDAMNRSYVAISNAMSRAGIPKHHRGPGSG